jgi:DnaT DNA-binding domain
MTHAQIDDRFDDHPKYSEYGAAEMGVIACAITYANRNLTDGRIPRIWPRRRFGQTGERIAKRLVEDGIWVQSERDCYSIAGFLDHNPSRIEVLARRSAAAERKAAAGKTGGIQSGITRRLKSQSESSRADSEAITKQTVEATSKHGVTRSLKQTGEANEALSSPLLSSPLLSMEKKEEIPCSPQDQKGSTSAPPLVLESGVHPVAPKRGRRGRAPRTHMVESWEPSPRIVAEVEQEHAKHLLDARAYVREFRRYWLGVGEARANWDSTFANRVDALVKRGEIYRLPKSGRPVAPARDLLSMLPPADDELGELPPQAPEPDSGEVEERAAYAAKVLP